MADQEQTSQSSPGRLPARPPGRPNDAVTRRGGERVSYPPAQIVVTGVFDDQVRAQQAASALDIWARANRSLGVSSIAVVGRKPSGATVYQTRRVLRPRRGALIGLLAGLVLLALPAAGAAALAAWVVGSVVLGMLGLVGVVPGGGSGQMTLTLVVGAATLAAVLTGVAGALMGALVGALVGFIDSTARGLGRAEVTRTLATLPAGSAAAVARTATPSSPLVVAELTRLGGAVASGAAPVARAVSEAGVDDASDQTQPSHAGVEAVPARRTS